MMIPKTKIEQDSITARYSDENEDMAAMRCFAEEHKEEYESFRQGFTSGIEWTKKNIQKEQKNLPCQVEINGLLWDTENLEINGQVYFTHDEALKAAASVGKRLPTEKEYKALLSLGWEWDEVGRGLWVANHKLFFPAAGLRGNDSGAGAYRGCYGLYWSAEAEGTLSPRLGFDASRAGMSAVYRTIGFSVRCVQDVK